MTSIEDFRTMHPYRLADGRCFASLHCAALSVWISGKPNKRLLPVVNTTTAESYDETDCRRAADTRPTPVIGMRKDYVI